MGLFANLAIFGIISLASRQIGQFVSRLRLPLITGYLFLGMVAGPYVLGIIPEGAADNLHVVDEVSLAFIAFAAGSELYLKELHSRMKSIAWITASLVVLTFLLGTAAVFFLAGYLPFMRELAFSGKLAISLLAGVILVARSPSSAIAIINEMRAKGPFTKTALGVTMIMDVVVIVLFAVNSSLAEGLLMGNGVNLQFILLLAVELSLSLLIGYLLGKTLLAVLGFHASNTAKISAILMAGYGVYVLSHLIIQFSQVYLPFEIFIEPLLVCMIAGFLVTNTSRFRDDFLEMLGAVSPAIYIVFFTLTGASISLDLLSQMWPIALTLFAVRLTGISLGSLAGGTMAGDPPHLNRLGWMAYITQAGVGLGLAKNVAVEFPEWGGSFATLMISVIVINQIVGPPFFKTAIRKAGESHLPEQAEPDEIRDAVILGIEGQSLALARSLIAHNWKVEIADTDRSHIEHFSQEGIPTRWLPEITPHTLSELILPSTDAVVAMLESDEANYTACEYAYEKRGITRLTVRLNNMSWAKSFREIGVMVVNPTSAMVSLLDQFVRSPQSAALLLHSDPDYEMVQVTISDPDVDGITLRDLRLPNDILVICVMRGNQSVVPHGYTSLQMQDELTLVGNPKRLEEISLRLGY